MQAHEKAVAGVAEHQAHVDAKPLLLGRQKWEGNAPALLRAAMRPTASNGKTCGMAAIRSPNGEKKPSEGRRTARRRKRIPS